MSDHKVETQDNLQAPNPLEGPNEKDSEAPSDILS